MRLPGSLGGGAGELERKNKSETSIENDKEGKVYGARERMALGRGKKQKIMSTDRNMPETIKSQCNKLSHTLNKLSQQFRLCQNAIKNLCV